MLHKHEEAHIGVPLDHNERNTEKRLYNFNSHKSMSLEQPWSFHSESFRVWLPARLFFCCLTAKRSNGKSMSKHRSQGKSKRSNGVASLRTKEPHVLSVTNFNVHSFGSHTQRADFIALSDVSHITHPETGLPDIFDFLTSSMPTPPSPIAQMSGLSRFFFGAPNFD